MKHLSSSVRRKLVNSVRDLVENCELVDSNSVSRKTGLDRLLCADFLLHEFREGHLSVTPEGTKYRGWFAEVQESDFGSNWRNV